MHGKRALSMYQNLFNSHKTAVIKPGWSNKLGNSWMYIEFKGGFKISIHTLKDIE